MTKTFIFLFFSSFAIGQIESKNKNLQTKQSSNNDVLALTDSTDYYISQLDCNSAIVTTTYFERLVLNPTAQRLVESNNENVNKKLLSHLDDTSKTLALHVILTKRVENNKDGFVVEYVYDENYKHILRVNYTCNNFHWFYLVIDDNPHCFFHFDKNEINRAKLYWTQKLK